MSYQLVKEYFDQIGEPNKIVTHDRAIDTVSSASEVLGCSEGEIAKTMSFLVRDEVVMIVMSGASKIHNHKFKETFGVKASMIPYDMVEQLTSHEPGGVCPFAVPQGVKIYLDQSLKQYNIVHAAGGSTTTTVSCTIPELERYSKALGWVDVSKLPNEEI